MVRLHEIRGSISSVMPNQSSLFYGMHQSIPSTYQVHTRYVQVHTSKSFVIMFKVHTSMYSVWTVLHWCIPIYSAVPPCSVVFWYIPPCSAGHNPEDSLNPEYNSVCVNFVRVCMQTTVCIQMLTNWVVLWIQGILRIVTGSTRWYVQEHSSTRQYCTIDRYTPMQHCAIPCMYRICCKCSWYALRHTVKTGGGWPPPYSVYVLSTDK